MPHIVVEYSDNLHTEVQQSNLLSTLHQVVLRSGLFSPEAIKARAQSYQHYILPEGSNNFIHITVSILSGRNIAQRKALSEAVFQATKQALAHVSKVSVNIHEMDALSYKK